MKKRLMTILTLSLTLFSCGKGEEPISPKPVEDKQFVLTVEGGESYSISTNVNILSAITNVPEKDGYTLNYWTIDGKIISSGALYTYDSDKTIVPFFTANHYQLSLKGASIVKDVIYDQPIGDLPTAEGETGYLGIWKIDDDEINDKTIWKYTENKTAEAGLKAKKYELSFDLLPETKLEVTYKQKIGSLPAVPNTSESLAGYWTIDETEINPDTVWTYDTNKQAVAKYIKTKDEFTTVPEDKGAVSLNNEKVYDVWNNYTYGYSEKYRVNLADQYENNPLTISWSTDVEYAYYRILIGQKEDLSDAQSYIVFDSNFSLDNAFTNTTYYYQIKAYDDKEELKTVSLVKSLVVEEGPRTITCDGVSNFRDLGGNLTTFEGKKIKQGMIYRSANVDSLAQASLGEGKRIFTKELKITTDLDIRNPAESAGRTKSPSGCPKYIQYTGIYYKGGEQGIDVGNNTIQFGKEVAVFADASNYPIDFHCAIGRDRTGCLAAALLGLLGVSYEDICKDYELSFLSWAATQDNSKAGIVTSIFRPFVDYMISRGGSGTLSEKIEYFLINSCGVTKTQVDSIKSIMLEDK